MSAADHHPSSLLSNRRQGPQAICTPLVMNPSYARIGGRDAEVGRSVETYPAMRFARLFTAAICATVVASLPAAASNLVTGNGFGFAVVSPDTASVTSFYAHPYSFVRPDPQNALSEGIPTANFIKSVRWSDESAHSTSAEYEEDSNVIHARSSAGEGFFFMPFGLEHSALVLSWDPSVADTQAAP